MLNAISMTQGIGHVMFEDVINNEVINNLTPEQLRQLAAILEKVK
jgi:hypothetical protein